MHQNVIFFAHGKESGPWGSKIQRLAEVGKARGFAVESPDYAGVDDPDERVRRLLAFNPKAANRLVLVGSSMGAYVSLVASRTIRPDGLFLLAPAIQIPFYPEFEPPPQAGQVEIIHGWQDEVIPVNFAIDYARKFHTTLHLVESDHRLMSALPMIESWFADFLERVLI
ncbi:MAG: alpha/beta fold hydrolase [Acidobacteria bacterium]|nr:alpha/beta fold hydrolase [Acidobacteriota bacterium]